MCASCGAAVPEGARFCPACGRAVHALADERRIVTVLFADLVGFTTFSETRDPEHVKNVVDGCFEGLAADITTYGGRVDKVIGDALVALFGAPVAHEDDAERAVRAALQMQRTVSEAGLDLELRVGINTGEVLVGALRAGGDYTAMGDVVNVASRLQTMATAGGVVVGPSTHAATRAVVAYEPLGAVRAKGRGELVDAWQALDVLAPPGRRPRRSRTPLIGRDEELGLLENALRTAISRRRTHVVVLLGEAGIGKSRLATELAATAAETHEAVVLEGRCLPYGEANVWWPVAEAVRQACGIEPDDDAATSREKCRDSVARATELDDPDEQSRLTEGLMHLMGHQSALTDVDPARAAQESRRSVQALIQGLARHRPLVVALSELHWADSLLLTLIDELLERAVGLPVVLLITARPELEERWTPKPGRHNTLTLHLDPLDREASTRMLTSMLESPLATDLRDLLLERSGGNPLFIEELVALLAESTYEHAATADLPATLRGLVAARIDTLVPSARAALEDASVVGRTGAVDTLHALADRRGEREAAIDELTSRDLLILDDGEWAFRSELVREVAYDTLTKAERARRHAAVAGWLAERARDLGREDEELEQIAHHYGAAAELVRDLGAVSEVPDNITMLALKSIERAAIRARERDLHVIATALLDRALRLIGPDDLLNRHRILVARARALASMRELSRARADVERVFDEGAATGRARAAALSVLGLIQQAEGALAESSATLGEAVRVWRDEGDTQGMADALRIWGMTRLFGGDADGAEGPIFEALYAFREIGDRQGEAWALQNVAWIAFTRGDMAEAEKRLGESETMFRAIRDHGGLGWALGLLAYVRLFQGRFEEAGQLAERVLGDVRDSNDRWGTAMTLMLLGSVRLFTGHPLDAIEHLEQARTLFEASGDVEREAQVVGTKARALLMAGRIDEGIALVDLARGAPERLFGHDGAGRLVTASAAAQLGAPHLVGHEVDAPSDPLAGTLGSGERGVVTGLLLLQSGESGAALRQLEHAAGSAHSDGERAFARAAFALALAANDRPDEAVATAASLAELSAGTYLDRLLAAEATGLAWAATGDASRSDEAFSKACALVDGTHDVLNQAIVRLGWGVARTACDHPDATKVLEDARARFADMGAPPGGWETAFRLAAGLG